MTFVQTYGKELFSLAVPFITWALNRWLRAKVKLLIATPHSFTFLVPEPLRDAQGQVLRPTQTVHTQSIMIQNAGTETATNLELVFNWKPPCINFWPVRRYTENVLPDNRYSVVFESLAPRESVGCETFSINADLPALMLVRSNQGPARPITMYPQPVVPLWRVRLLLAVAAIGLGTLVYFAISLIQFLVLATPFMK